MNEEESDTKHKERLMLIVPQPLVGTWIKEFHERNTKLNYYQSTVYKHASMSKEKGFLIWHDMGTGKTLTGINYLTSFIPAASLTDNVNLQDVCQIVTYDDLIAELLAMRYAPEQNEVIEAIFDFENRRIVIDEAHNITTIMRNDKILKEVRMWFYYHLRHSCQVLLMSGTPMYHSAMDIATLINLCTPEQKVDTGTLVAPLIPFDEIAFRKEFFKISYWRVGLYGWLIPILNNPLIKFSALILTGAAFTKFVIDLSYQLKNGAASFQVTKKMKNVATGYMLQNGLNAEGKDNVNDGERYNVYKASTLQDTLHNSSGGRFLLKMSRMIGMDSNLEKGESSGIAAVWAFPLGLTAAFCSILAILKKYDLNSLYYLNCKRLGARIGPFMSYYTHRPIEISKVKTLSKRIKNKTLTLFKSRTVCEKGHFKPEFFKVINVPFNKLQNTLFLDFTIGCVDVDHQHYFQEKNKSGIIDYYNYFGTNYEKDTFLKYGRVIGSLSLSQHNSIKNDGGGSLHPSFNSIAKQWPDLFAKVPSSRHRTRRRNNRTRRRGGANVHSKALLVRDGVRYPLKFHYVLYYVLHTLQHHKKGAEFLPEHAHHVVFSEFKEHALLPLKHFIETTKRDTIVPHPKKASAPIMQMPDRPLVVMELPEDGLEPSAYDVLLLDANKTEGINLHLSDNLHILEPVSNPSRLDQLKARTNRYNNFGYTPKSRRINYVRMYISTNQSFCTNLCRKIKHFATANNKQGRIFWKRFKLFDQDTTPDRIVYQKMFELRNNIKSLSNSCARLAKLNHTSLEYDSCRKTVALMPNKKAISECRICQNKSKE